MAKKKKPSEKNDANRLDEIKKLAVTAMFSDDDLLERLVLKGGNAINLIHRISTRASYDVDFSMPGDFSEQEKNSILSRLEALLKTTFRPAGLEIFDVRMEETPKGLSADLADFWGGYAVEFKAKNRAGYEQFAGDLEALRKHALKLGKGDSPRFSIDISKHEYTAGKERHELFGLRIFVYSPEMLVCEKLRAICQQMPEYGPVVKRRRAGAARARDFLDIHTLVVQRDLDMTTRENRELLRHIFLAKRVPLFLLGRMGRYREFHRGDFPAVKDTVKPGVKLEDFDFYFDFVLKLVSSLKIDVWPDRKA